MNKIRFGIIGMGVQGSYYADILTGRRAGIARPEGCALASPATASDMTGS